MKRNRMFSTVACLMLILGLESCATQGTRANRHVSGNEDGMLVLFMKELSHESSASPADFEKAFVNAVNKNADALSISQIHSPEDIRAMSAADQEKLVKQLAADSTLKDSLALSSDSVAASARLSAIQAQAQPTEEISTQGVADIRKSTSTEGSASAELTAAENADVKPITGFTILGERCDQLTDPAAARNLRVIMEATHSDVVAGRVRQPAEIAADLDENIAKTEGTNKGVAHNRRCSLAQPKSDANGCAVFSEAMYVGCDD